MQNNLREKQELIFKTNFAAFMRRIRRLFFVETTMNNEAHANTAWNENIFY